MTTAGALAKSNTPEKARCGGAGILPQLGLELEDRNDIPLLREGNK
jgi:hypothetical protein